MTAEAPAAAALDVSDALIVGYLITWEGGGQHISPIQCHADDGTNEPLVRESDYRCLQQQLATSEREREVALALLEQVRITKTWGTDDTELLAAIDRAIAQGKEQQI